MDNNTSRGVVIAAGAVLGAAVLCAGARHFCAKKSSSSGCSGSCKCGQKSEQKSAEHHDYVLTYYTMRARAEVSRLLFAAAKVEYKDVRFEMSPQFKHDGMKADRSKNPEKYPYGQLPTLQVDGGEIISQSHAIERYLAKEFGFFGSNKTEAALIDGVTEAMADIHNSFITICLTLSAANQPQALAAHYKKHAPTFSRLEQMLRRSKSGFLVGTKPSVADLSVFHWVHTQCIPDFLKQALKDLPQLQKHKATVENMAGVSEWLAVRPDTFF